MRCQEAPLIWTDNPRLLRPTANTRDQVPPPTWCPSMEMSQTSPPPTSPAEGDDPCEIDVTDMAIDGVTLLIGLCGLVGNGAVLWLLGFHIRRNPITVYILNLAVADFTFLLFVITSSLLYMVDSASCSTVVSLRYLRSFLLLSLFSYNMGLYLLTAISIERCGSILCPLWYRCHRPQHLSGVMCALLWVLSVAVIATVTSLCLTHKDEPCQMSLISMYILNLLVFAPPMVISSTVVFIKVKCGSQQQQPRRLHIIIFLTVLFFLIFALPLSLSNFLQQLSYTVVSSQVVFLLACIHSSIKPLTYFLMGSCWRRCSLVSLRVSFQRVFEETEENTACSNGAVMDTVVPAC
ncbi:mas-related G-protein coupled receptor member H-like isoform X1 [Manacus candei]|uniref:mas-related G-protein coupled receptor member H-like isoform X1 n=2 Tax=Manacus candei TaxID=415023 RepID=UPI002227ACE0|nr:mas-related G-protein coupled receptor member H-like isoform X1 [Manacus candei]